MSEKWGKIVLKNLSRLELIASLMESIASINN